MVIMIDLTTRQDRKLSVSPKLYAIIFTLLSVQLGVGSAESAQQNNRIEMGNYDVAYNDAWTSATQVSNSSNGFPVQLDDIIVRNAMHIEQLNLYGRDVANIPVDMPQLQTLRLKVNYIGDNSFEKSPNLEAIIINPQSDDRSTTISPLGFAKLRNLKKIYMDKPTLESYLSSGTQFLKPFTGCNPDCKIYTDRNAFYYDDESSPGYLGTVSEVKNLKLQELKENIGSQSANLTPQYPPQSSGFNQSRAMSRARR
jgi:hypothetical protein